VNFWRRILRLYSLAFNALFVLVTLGIVLVVLLSRPSTVNFYLLPWEGGALIYGLSVLAIIGLVVLLFAWRGQMQGLFILWSIVVLALIVRYFFFSPFRFSQDTAQLLTALGIMLASLLAAVGAAMKPGRDRG